MCIKSKSFNLAINIFSKNVGRRLSQKHKKIKIHSKNKYSFKYVMTNSILKTIDDFVEYWRCFKGEFQLQYQLFHLIFYRVGLNN